MMHQDMVDRVVAALEEAWDAFVETHGPPDDLEQLDLTLLQNMARAAIAEIQRDGTPSKTGGDD